MRMRPDPTRVLPRRSRVHHDSVAAADAGEARNTEIPTARPHSKGRHRAGHDRMARMIGGTEHASMNRARSHRPAAP